MAQVQSLNEPSMINSQQPPIELNKFISSSSTQQESTTSRWDIPFGLKSNPNNDDENLFSTERRKIYRVVGNKRR